MYLPMLRRTMLAVALAPSLCAADVTIASSTAPGISSPVKAVQGIDPPRLFLSEAAGERRCVDVVTISDPGLACQAYRCHKVFPSDAVLAIKASSRALRVQPCAATSRAGGDLLWGSDSLLVLQPGREGAGLWEQVKQGRRLRITIMTEASDGTLRMAGTGYMWTESP